MTLRRALVTAAAVVAALAAAAAVLVARSASAVDHRLAVTAAQLSAGDGRAVAHPGRRDLPFRIAEGLLGAGSDLGFRRAAGLAEAALPADPVGRVTPQQRGDAEIALSSYTDSGTPARRSQAENLLGALILVDAYGDPANMEQHLQTAIRHFQNAVRLDPGNAAPKFNLELALTADFVGQPGTSAATRGSTGPSRATPGRGY